MNNLETKSGRTDGSTETYLNIFSNPTSGTLYSLFGIHLSRLYCDSSYLVARLPELKDQIKNQNSKKAIALFQKRVNKQMRRIEKISQVLGVARSFDNCKELVSLMEYSYHQVICSINQTGSANIIHDIYLEDMKSLKALLLK